MKRGEVWWATLPRPWGTRPVLLLARDEAYELLTWVVVAPITTTVRGIPAAVTLEPESDGVPQRSAVSLDHLQTVRREWLDDRITELSADRLREVDDAVHFALALSF